MNHATAFHGREREGGDRERLASAPPSPGSARSLTATHVPMVSVPLFFRPLANPNVGKRPSALSGIECFPAKALVIYPVFGQSRSPLQVVYLGRSDFRLPERRRIPLLSRQQARPPAGNLSPGNGSFCTWLLLPWSDVFVLRCAPTLGGLASMMRTETGYGSQSQQALLTPSRRMNHASK
jgi:hypothetical protein